MGKLSAASVLTAPAIDDYFWVYDASDPTNLKKIAHADLSIPGSFTPTLSGSTAEGGQSYTTQIGRYSRIGNMIAFNIHIETSAKGSPTGNIIVKGLPFASANNAGIAVAFVSGFTLTATRELSGYISASSTDIILLESDGLTQQAPPVSMLGSTASIMVSGVYFVS